MKNNSKTRVLVEQILNEEYLDANKTLKSLVLEAEGDREDDIADDIGTADDAGDAGDTGDSTDAGEAEGEEDTGDAGDAEEIDTNGIDEPTDGDPNLGDDLGEGVDGAEDAVSDGEMTEMSNDVVEISCEINQKIISKLYDKISNLKTTLNSNNDDKDSREFITLETKLSYYGNKLEELQSKTNPAIDQKKVEERIDLIEAALKTLESEINGGSSDDEVKSTDELDAETDGEPEAEGEAETEGDTEGEAEGEAEGEGEEETEGESKAEAEGEQEAEPESEGEKE